MWIWFFDAADAFTWPTTNPLGQILKVLNQKVELINYHDWNVQIPEGDFTIGVGDKSFLDSMNLVELCLSLEDKATEAGFEFDWTSENAMSKSKGMFRTVKSLAEEFNKQAKSIE